MNTKFVLACAAMLLLLGCSPEAELELSPLVLVGPEGRSVALSVEIARTAEEHGRGLMDRTELPEGTGMLFVFREEAVREFWMRNTLIPLDVLFFDGQLRFLSVRTMEPCVTEECPSYSSELPARYALEVPAGFTQERGIGDGWRLVVPKGGW